MFVVGKCLNVFLVATVFFSFLVLLLVTSIETDFVNIRRTSKCGKLSNENNTSFLRCLKLRVMFLKYAIINMIGDLEKLKNVIGFQCAPIN